MDKRLTDLYLAPDLREHCAALEERVLDIPLSPQDRQILESYIDMRNELEFETVKLALRWGKRHYR